MSTRRNPRGGRSGRGLYPPNPRQWGTEKTALRLRDELGLEPNSRLIVDDAYALLDNVVVVPHGHLPADAAHIELFRGSAKRVWSGFALPLEDGGHIVVFNDRHHSTRIRATLMEEFFHIRLGHSLSRVRLYDGSGRSRTYDAAVEREAYGCGAAALIPYAGLRRLIDLGCSTSQIASHYDVSEQLVWFRAKVTRMYRRIKAA